MKQSTAHLIQTSRQSRPPASLKLPAGPKMRIAGLLVSGSGFLAAVAKGQTIFHDELEGGAGNWSVYAYPGAPACTPMSYVSTGTAPTAHRGRGGGAGCAGC